MKEKCNCENIHCEHEPAACTGEGVVRFEYVGKICMACARRMPVEYLIGAPPIGTLILWNNRFGVITEACDKFVRCEGLPGFLRQTMFTVDNREFSNGNAKFCVDTTSLYDFQEALGENVYDPNGYAEGYRVLETAKNMSGRYDGEDRPEYWVKLYDENKRELKMLAIYRSAVDGILRWTTM